MLACDFLKCYGRPTEKQVLDAFWIVLLGMAITFASMGILLLVMIILKHIPGIGTKKDARS